MIKIFIKDINQEYTQITKFKPVDIIESLGYIIVAEENNFIEIFFFGLEEINLIKKLYEIQLTEQVTCIEGGNEFLFFGYKNGFVSVWNIQKQEPYLNLIKQFRLHYDSILKYYVMQKTEIKSY